MKHLKAITLATIVLLTISCSKSDSPKDNASIIGTWKLTSDVSEGVEYVEEGDCDVLYIFTSNTIAIEEYDGANCDEVDTTDNTWSYSIENNMVIGFDYNEDTLEDIDVEIETLTETTLKLVYPDGDYIIMERQ